MWTRFTERARLVIYSAQTHAQNRGLKAVLTEHLLLGIADDLTNTNGFEHNQAVEILSSLGVERPAIVAALNAKIEASAGTEKANDAEKRDMQLSEEAKRVIDFAFDEARLLNNNYIGTEHLLLGLLREPNGRAGVALREMGVTLETAQKAAAAQKAATGVPGVLNRLKAFLRPAPAAESAEPIVTQGPQPLGVLERSPEQIARLREVLDKADYQAYAAILRTESYIELPPDTDIEVLDNDAPLLQMYRQVRVLSGKYAGRIFSAHAINVDPVQPSSTDSPLSVPGRPADVTQNKPIPGVLRVPPAPQGKEPVAGQPLQPVPAFDLTKAETEFLREAEEKRDYKTYAAILRGESRTDLPPNTEVEVLDNDAPSILNWRRVLVLSGDYEGKTFLVSASFIVPGGTPSSLATPGEKITLPNAPENRPSAFDSLLRAAVAVQSDAFDLTAGTPLTLKNALTEDDIERLIKGILTYNQSEAVERGEVAEAWCAITGETPSERIEFSVDVYRIKGRLTARFRKA